MDLEAKANLLRKEALQCITIALTGSDTKKFWELLVVFFGANHKGTEEDDPWDFLDVAPAIPPPLPLTETESDDEKTSVKSAPVAPSTKVKAPRKPVVSQQKDLLDDLCGLKAAIRMYPADAGSLKETGIPPELQVKREHQTTCMLGARFICVLTLNARSHRSLLRVPREYIPTFAESTLVSLLPALIARIKFTGIPRGGIPTCSPSTAMPPTTAQR